MKKIVSLVILASMLLSQGTISKVYATDLPKDEVKALQTNSSTSSQLLEQYKAESELFGTPYEEVKKPVPRSITVNKDEREEFTLDRNGLSSITALRSLTSANYEIVLYYPDKQVYATNADTLQSAILKAKGLASSDPNAIPAVLDTKSSLIVYATEAVGRMIKVVDGEIYMPTDRNTNVYSSSLLKTAYTYVNHGYVDDVPILDDTGTSAKVEVSGYTGWVDKDTTKAEYDLMVVPLNRAVNPSYYASENGELKHYISYDVVNRDGSRYAIKLGPAPSFMKSGVKYYSYDNNYFYTSLKTLIADGKAGHHNNSVNASNPYYNYYQFLPFRSKSSFSSSQINTYLESYAGLTPTSKLRGIGQALINGQNQNGVNALITFGVACNESGLGNSSISQQKNNIFGINAVDSNPAGSANAFASVDDCINDFTKNYFSRDYGDPDDWKHFGAYLGNKNLGANVKYASDPFWGEKAAQYMYKMDFHTSNSVVLNAGSNASTSNLRDFNNYQLGMYSAPSSILTSPSSSASKLYAVTQEVKTGTGKVGNIFVAKSTNLLREGSTSYYNITPDRTTIPWSAGGRFDGTFDWNKEAYVSANSIKLINTPRTTPITPPSEAKKGWVLENNIWYYYDEATGTRKTGWILDNNRWYYLDSNGAMKTGFVTVGNYVYYLNKYGAMETGLQTIEGKTYYFNMYGAMQTGLVQVNGKTYYFNNKGIMTTGWVWINSLWYYFNQDGTMKTGWLFTNGYWYYLQNDGIMKTGWLNLGKYWYYLNMYGAMETGWKSIDGTWYYMHPGGDRASGWLNLNGYWYYLNPNGSMATGWLTLGRYTYYLHPGGDMAKGWWNIGGSWYYFYPGGDRAQNTIIDGYKVGSDGKRLP